MKKIVPAIAAVLLVLGFIIYSHFGSAVRSVIENAGTQALGTPVHVGGVNVSLATRMAAINGLSVDNPSGFNGKFLETKSISAALGGVENKTVTIKEIVADGVIVTYDLGAGGSNFDVLQKNMKSKPSSPASKEKAESGGYEVIIQQLRITNAKVIASVAGRVNTLTLPEVVINNIGSKSHPATPQQVARQVIDHILAISTGAATGLNLKSLKGLGVDNVKSKLNGLLSR